MANTNPFLEALIYGVRDLIDGAGNAFVRRSKVKFVGSTIVDNPTTGTTEVTTSGGGGASPGGSDGDVQLKNGSAFAGVGGAKGSVLGYSGTAWQAEPSTVVNIMDYYQSGDGAPTVDGLTTKNIGPAFGRAYAATVGLHKHLTLWIPPCDAYGVQACSWEEAQTINTQTDNLWSLRILGSGQSAIIIPTQSGGLNDKLSVLGVGPAGQPIRFYYEDMFWRGDSTKTTDCNTVLATTADVSVRVKNCFFYGVEGNASGLLTLDCNDLHVADVNFCGCGNAGAAFGTDSAMISFYSAIFGAHFERVFMFPAEHTLSSVTVGPFGEVAFTKNTAACWGIWPRGDDPTHAPTIHLRQCVFGEVSYGAVRVDPDTGAGFGVESVTLDRCVFHSSVQRAIKAVSTVKRVTLVDCLLEHNYAAVPSVEMAASTCEMLVLERNRATHDLIQYRAQTGQKVIVRDNVGGDLGVLGAKQVTVDEMSTFDIFSGWAIERSLRGTSVAGASVNLADDGALEYQIPATSSFTLRVELLGSRTDAQGNSREVHEISGHSDATTITVDDDALVTALGGFVAAGWSAPTFTDAGSLVLRITCAGVAGQTVDFEAHVTGRSRPGHS